MKRRLCALAGTLLLALCVGLAAADEGATENKDLKIDDADSKRIEFLFDFACRNSDYTSLYWLLANIPIFNYSGNDGLKARIREKFLNTLRYCTSNVQKLVHFLQDDSVFPHYAPLVMYSYAHSQETVLFDVIFGTKTQPGRPGSRAGFISRLLSTANLTLFAMLESFLQSYYESNMCITLQLVGILGSLSKRNLGLYMKYVFPREIHRRYPKYLLMILKLPPAPQIPTRLVDSDARDGAERRFPAAALLAESQKTCAQWAGA